MFKNIYPKTHDHQVNIIQLKCADWKVSDGLGFCSPWNWPVVWASYKLSGSDICMIDWIGQVVNLNWLLRQYLSNRRVSEWQVWLQAFTSHTPTMTWGCNVLFSSFNLARNPYLWKQGCDSCLRRHTMYGRSYTTAQTGLYSFITIII